MGRRRRRIRRPLRPRLRLPDIFDCYICGSPQSVSIDLDRVLVEELSVKCNECGEIIRKELKLRPWYSSKIFHRPPGVNSSHEVVEVRVRDDPNILELKCLTCNQITCIDVRESIGWESLPCPCRLEYKFDASKTFAVIGCGSCGFKDYLSMPSGLKKVDAYARFQRLYERVWPPE